MDYNTVAPLSKQIALVLFFVTFVVIVVWAFWPSNKKKLEDAGSIALRDDEEQGK